MRYLSLRDRRSIKESIMNIIIDSMEREMKENKEKSYREWRERKIQSRKISIEGLNDLLKKGLINKILFDNILYSMGNMNESTDVNRINKNELIDYFHENNNQLTMKMIFDRFEFGLPEMKLRIRSFIIDKKIWISYDSINKIFKIESEKEEPIGWTGYRQKEKNESIINESIDSFDIKKSNLIKRIK